MLAGAALRKTGIAWEFLSEVALEDFVWDNLQQLSGLIPIECSRDGKPFYVNGPHDNPKKIIN